MRRNYVAIIAISLLGAFLFPTAATANIKTGASAARPGQVLISETSGMLWSYDIRTGEVSEFAAVSGGNFDIQFLGPQRLLIGNINGFVSQLDLRNFQETLVSDDALLTSPVGVASGLGATERR